MMTPLVLSFIPVLDGTPELGTDDHRFFQEMIGMLRWATELGRVDILHEVSLFVPVPGVSKTRTYGTSLDGMWLLECVR